MPYRSVAMRQIAASAAAVEISEQTWHEVFHDKRGLNTIPYGLYSQL
jgi:hypothetical protein